MKLAFSWPRKILLYSFLLTGLSILLTAGITVRAATSLWEKEFAERNVSFALYTSLDILHSFGRAFEGSVTADLEEAIRALTVSNQDLQEVMILSRTGRVLYPSGKGTPSAGAGGSAWGEDLFAVVGRVIEKGEAVSGTFRSGDRRLLDVVAPVTGLGGARPLAVRYLYGYGSLDRKVSSLLAWVGAGAVVLFLAGLVLSTLLARALTRPVMVLSQGARRIAAGDRAHRIQLATGDEMEALAGQFNRTMEALARQQEELEQANRELTEANLRMRELQEQLLRSERLAALGQLSAGVSHELDNPVGVILGYAQLLQEEGDGGATREYASIIAGEANRCKRIIAGLLDLSRAGRGVAERIDLAESAANLVEQLREQRPFRRVSWRVALGGEVRMVGMDPDALRQVLVNLALNAAQAMPGGGEIRLEASASSDRGRAGVLLAVSDSGCGIPAGQEEKVFEPFFTTKKRGEGTGLGLPICRKLMEEAGGWIRTGPSAGGAVFHLWFPLAGPSGDGEGGGEKA